MALASCRPALFWGQVALPPSSEGCGGGGRGLSPTRCVADINECRRYSGRLCSHKCENTLGSFHCSCSAGFRLAPDGRSCEGEAGPGGPWGLTPVRAPSACEMAGQRGERLWKGCLSELLP